MNSIDNKRRLARGDHGEDSPVRRAELERQLMEAEFECRYAMDEDRDSAADWRDSLRRQLDELKRIEDEEIPCDLMRDSDGNLVNARGFLDDDGNVIDD